MLTKRGIHLCERRVESGGWRAENWLFGSHFSREGAPKTVEIRKIGI